MPHITACVRIARPRFCYLPGLKRAPFHASADVSAEDVMMSSGAPSQQHLYV
jgi:hypothetical protein